MSPSPALSVRGLTRSFGEVQALRDVGFEVSRGQVVGLLGPNGAGKTTTLRILNGTLAPDSGSVTVLGLDVVQNRMLVSQKVGFLPEQNPLDLALGVQSWLRQLGRLRGISRGKLMRAVDSVVHRCALTEVKTQRIGTLSKGYRQRVGLAGALLHEPELVILDEPTSGLDPNQVVELRRLISELAEERTVLLSSHILSEVEATCDRVVILDRGKVAAEGTTEALKAELGSTGAVVLEIGPGPDEGVLRSELQRLPGNPSVSLQECTGNGSSWHISAHGELDPRPAIVALCAESGWSLLGLRSSERSLEDVFRQLTNNSAEE